MTPTVSPERQLAAQQALAQRHLLPFVKLTFPRYVVNPVSQLVAKELEWFEREVEAGNSPRMILEMPPRVGKSELVSRRFPGWLLGRHPDWNIGLISYGADLAERLSRDARRVVMSEEFGQIFTKYDTEEVEQVEIDKTSKSVNYWRIAALKDVPQPGGMQAAGINGPVTGSGFNVLLFDDPHKNWEEANSRAAKDRVWNYYVGTLYDRLEPGAGILVVMQRWAVDDLVGRLLQVDDTDEEGFAVEYLDKWKVIRLAAQAEAGEDDPLHREPGQWLPARYTAEQWERAKANNMKKNPRIWEAKFQQHPSPSEGTFFQRHWLRFEDEPEDREGPIFIFLDTSYSKNKTSDYNAATVWRLETKPQEQFRLLDVYRKRSPYPELKKDIIDLCAKYGLLRPPNVIFHAPRVIIEDTKAGQSLLQEFMRPVFTQEHGLVRIPAKGWPPVTDKDARAHTVTPLMAEGKVVLPKRAPWLKDYLDELLNFQGEGSIAHDDQVDSSTMALILMGTQQAARKRTEIGHIPFSIVA